MKLYVTAASPYARIARIVVHEKGLSDRARVLMIKTRIPDSPYYKINPSGRVPYLVRDDGVGMEDSRLIAAYLDQLDGKPTLTYPQSLETGNTVSSKPVLGAFSMDWPCLFAS
jgi:glutathione S-transferase